MGFNKIVGSASTIPGTKRSGPAKVQRMAVQTDFRYLEHLLDRGLLGTNEVPAIFQELLDALLYRLFIIDSGR